MEKIPVIPVILGPTASSKTSVGIELAKLIDGEVISVDSRKVYKGLSIGTATPKGEWKDGAYWVQGVAHHLMAFLNPDKIYTAGDFAKDAEDLIAAILGRGKIPILVGGTGFYFKSLRDGLPLLPIRNEEIRQQMTRKIEIEGLKSLFEELQKKDPAAAKSIGPSDPHKIIRALEVTYITGQPFSSWKNMVSRVSSYQYNVMGLDYPKPLLNKRIEERSQHMFESGMIQETAAVLKQGYSKSCAALSSFGYHEAVQVLDGELPEFEFLDRLIQGTKSYAKRQRTWFRTKVVPSWLECDENTKGEEIALKMKAFCERPIDILPVMGENY